MFLFVYRLRAFGNRLRPADILREPPKFGRLVMREERRGDVKIAMANLYDDATADMLQPLIHCRVVRINMGMRLAGTEYHGHGGAKSRDRPSPQSWLCAAKAEELETLVKMIRMPSATGFDEADD